MDFCAQTRPGVFDFDTHVRKRAELFHHRKPDARSLRGAGHLVFHAVEFLEHLLHFGRRDARTVVADGEVYVVDIDFELDDDHLVVRVLRELERVVHQVRENLHHRVAVHHQLHLVDIGVARYRERESVVLDVLGVHGDEVVEHGLRAVLADVRHPAIAVELREVEHVLNESRESVAFACDLVEAPHAFRVVHLVVAALQDFCAHLDGGERGLELVTYGRYEILTLLGEVELALRESVDGNEAAPEKQEHDAADKEQQLSVGNDLPLAVPDFLH